jgi:hypothetical protein
MSQPSRIFSRTAAVAAAPVAILAAGALVWQSSSAAFTSNTRSAGNAWSTGQVTLTDDDLGRAGFTVTYLLPGQTGQHCLVVKSNSTVAGEVRAYTQNVTSSNPALADHIMFHVDKGTGGSFNDCTGFVADAGSLPALPLSTLANANKDYATGGGVWDTAGTPGETKVYRGTWTFDTTGMTQQQVDSLQNAQVSMDMVWELQSA